ncbi:hypothetical protein ACFC3Z_12170 [Enterococcus thailandicus]|uniref:hypothetical protein n=1 Tax=Enterococcus thailandicus TaxID=417368 RepID=UPI0035DB0A13
MNQDYKRIQQVLSNIDVNITLKQAQEIWEYYSICCYMSNWVKLPVEDRDLYFKVVNIILTLNPISNVDNRPRPAYFNSLSDQINISTSKIMLEKMLFFQNLIYYEIPKNEPAYKRNVYFEYKNSNVLGLSIIPEERKITFYSRYKGKEMLSKEMILKISSLLEKLWTGLKAYVDIEYGEFQDYKIKRY